MSQKTLGILVTSEKHDDHLIPLFLAAGRKKIALTIHFQGEGVRLCLLEKYKDMMAKVNLSICRRSAETLGLTGRLRSLYPHAMEANRNASIRISQCTRHIVL